MPRKLSDFYFTLDLRSLGLYRICLALLLIHDWCGRWPNLEAFYTAAGLCPTPAALPQVGGAYHLSLLDPVGSLGGVRFVFGLGLVCYLLLLVGWRTRIFQVLAFLFFASVRTRNALVCHGADTVLVTMSLWTLFLPLGARYSVDSLRAAFRRGVPLRRRRPPVDAEPAPRSPRSLAALAIVLQIGLISVATATATTGDTWRDGTAALLEFATLPLLLVPFGQPWPRRVVLAGLTTFHLGTLATRTLGSLPLVMISTYLLLLLPEDWEALERWAGRGARTVVAYYDDTCGFCHRCCQVLALADAAGRIRFVGNTDRTAFLDDVPAADLEASLVVQDAVTGRRTLRAAALASLARALPLPCRPLAVLAWPGIRTVADRLYDLVARNRYRLSEKLGYVACGVQRVPEDVAAAPPPRSAAGPALRLGRDAVVAFLLATTLVESWNDSLAGRLHAPLLRTPAWTRAPILALDLVHGGRMLAPDPWRGDGWWVADAVTADGTRVDLLTGRPTTWEKPARLERRYDVFWRAYLDNVSQPRYHDFRLWFGRYLVRRAALGPLRFEFWYVQEETQPPRMQRFRLWEYNG